MIFLLCSLLILINDLIIPVTHSNSKTVHCDGLSRTFIVFQSNAMMDPNFVRKMSIVDLRNLQKDQIQDLMVRCWPSSPHYLLLSHVSHNNLQYKNSHVRVNKIIFELLITTFKNEKC